MLFYVLITRCFSSVIENLFHIVNEALVSAFYFIILLSNLPEFEENSSQMLSLCIYIISTSWGLVIFCGVLSSGLKIWNAIKDMIKKRATGNTKKVYPEKNDFKVETSRITKYTQEESKE